MTKIGTGLLCALALGLSAPAGAAGFKHENKPENLRALFSNIHQAAHGKKDAKQAAELMQSVMPDEARVRKALKDNVPADTLQRIVGFHQKMGPVSERDVVKLAKPEQKNVQVHAARPRTSSSTDKGLLPSRNSPVGRRRLRKPCCAPG